MTYRNPKALVIGYGNALRADDGFGPHVADRLRQFVDASWVRVLIKHCLTPEVAFELSEVEVAIFIDASLEGTIGELNCRRLECPPGRWTTMAHTSDPAGLLALAIELYERAPRTYLVSVRGDAFDLQPDRLSASVQSAVHPATRTILLILEEELYNDPRRIDPVHV